jgi:hypothetical protein
MDGDLTLRTGTALPVLADRHAAQEGFAEDAGPVGGTGEMSFDHDVVTSKYSGDCRASRCAMIRNSAFR